MTLKALRVLYLVLASLGALAICAALYVLPASWRPAVALWLLVGVPLTVFVSRVFASWSQLKAARLASRDQDRQAPTTQAPTWSTLGRRGPAVRLQVLRHGEGRDYSGRFTL